MAGAQSAAEPQPAATLQLTSQIDLYVISITYRHGIGSVPGRMRRLPAKNSAQSGV
jgi:hypothetical protein